MRQILTCPRRAAALRATGRLGTQTVPPWPGSGPCGTFKILAGVIAGPNHDFASVGAGAGAGFRGFCVSAQNLAISSLAIRVRSGEPFM
jgi:hypothetical protein